MVDLSSILEEAYPFGDTTAWQANVYASDQKLGKQTYRYILTENRISCPNRKFKLEQSVFYDKKGNPVSTTRFDKPFSTIVPGSVLDEFREIVCSKGGRDKAAQMVRDDLPQAVEVVSKYFADTKGK